MTLDEAQRLVNWADAIENSDPRTSLYWRIQERIEEARAMVRATRPSQEKEQGK